MGYHRTHVVLALGHFGVRFRLMESGLLRSCCSFSFGTFCGSVQADGFWSPQDLLGVQPQDIVGFSSG